MTDATASEITPARHPFKKAAWTALAAINLVTLVSSFMVADRGMTSPESGAGIDTVRGLIAAPVMTAFTWRGVEMNEDLVGGTPVEYLGGKAHKYTPAVVDGTLNAAVTIGGIPGAYAGYLGGVLVGAFTPDRVQSPAKPVGPG